MTRRTKAVVAAVGVTLLIGSVAAPLGRAADMSTEMSAEIAVKYMLAIVRAFRTVYAHSVIEQVKKAGVESKENWKGDDHAVMLPFQLVKLAGLEIREDFKNIEVGVVSLTPIYSSNFPKTPVEVEALTKLTANPKQKMLTFADGNQFTGLAADFAIEQACADCHNHHPNSTRHDFKKGDLMGALVVRLKK